MATAIQPLTVEEFHHRFDGVKPYYEFWYGEAVQKSMPTWLHSVLQRLITELLSKAGYKAGQEVELRIDPDWQPVPDVIGTMRIEQPYPTSPVEIVVEVLSPDDKTGQTLQKCHNYARIGVRSIFVLDPERQEGWQWNAERKSLDCIKIMSLPNGEIIRLSEVWLEMMRRLDG